MNQIFEIFGSMHHYVNLIVAYLLPIDTYLSTQINYYYYVSRLPHATSGLFHP